MLQVLEGPTIQAGESLSDALDCSAGQLVCLVMPAAWDKASLTFQVSPDGVSFYEMYGLDGFAVTIKEVVPGAAVIIPADIGRAIAHIKFRSGTEGNPDPQEEARTFAAVMVEAEKTVPVMVLDPREGPPVRPRPKPKR